MNQIAVKEAKKLETRIGTPQRGAMDNEKWVYAQLTIPAHF